MRTPHRSDYTPKGEKLTQNNFAQDADINNKVARHLRGNPNANLSNIGQGGTRQPIFGDSTRIDYQNMLNKVTDIDQQFAQLPSRIRSRFRNRPDQLLAFLEDKKNLKEAVKLGLCTVPDGCSITAEGDLIEQVDLVDESKKTQPEPQKPDPEANPNFKTEVKK